MRITPSDKDIQSDIAQNLNLLARVLPRVLYSHSMDDSTSVAAVLLASVSALGPEGTKEIERKGVYCRLLAIQVGQSPLKSRTLTATSVSARTAEFGPGCLSHGSITVKDFDHTWVAARRGTSLSTLPHAFISSGLATDYSNNMTLRRKAVHDRITPPVEPER